MILERIVVSTKEPLNKNVLWIDGTDIKYWGPNGWSGLDVTENDKLWTSIQEEIKDREDADIAITEKLDKEIQDRINAITTVTEALNKEVSDRQEADTSLEERLNQRIDDEIANREEGDTSLTDKLNQEITDRTNADNTLDSRITQEIADRKSADTAIQTDLDNFKNTKGEASGLAPLNESGKVDSQYLPSFVDDVVDVYATYEKDEVGNLTNIQLYSDPEHQNPITGEAGKIYQNIAEDEPAYQFRWTGTVFTPTGATGLIIGEITGTAYDGGKGKHTTDVVNSIPSGMVSNLNRTPGSDSVDIDVVRYVRGGDGTFTQDIPRTVNIPAATISTAGVMSSADKQKLDGLKEAAELETELQGIKDDVSAVSDKVGTNTYTDANYISKETNLTDATLQLDEEIKATNDNLAILNAATIKGVKVGNNTTNESVANGIVTIANATTTADGALSKEDKSKLDLLFNIEDDHLGLQNPEMTSPRIYTYIEIENSSLEGYNLSRIWKDTGESIQLIPTYTDHYLSFGFHSNGALTTGLVGNTARYAVFSPTLSSKDTWNLNDYLDDKFNTGDGTKFLADNFTYKSIAATDIPDLSSKYLPLSGGTMTGIIRIPYNGLQTSGNASNSLIFYNDTELWYGSAPYKAVFDTSNTDMIHRKYGVNYIIYDESNFVAGTDYLAPGAVTIADISDLGNNWSSVLANNVQSKNFTVNGATRSVYAPSTETFSIYAPTTAGTSGQVLVSNGEGQAPSWSDMNVDLGDLSSTHYIQNATSIREALIALDAKIYELFQALTLNQ